MPPDLGPVTAIAANGYRTVVTRATCVSGKGSNDCNANGVLDSCEIATGAQDKDADSVLDECELARGDFDLDGTVGAADLSLMLASWGVTNPPIADLNDDGMIGAADLSLLLGNWGPY